MSDNKKYVVIGIVALLIPLGRLLLRKMRGEFCEESEQDSAAPEEEKSTPIHKPAETEA